MDFFIWTLEDDLEVIFYQWCSIANLSLKWLQETASVSHAPSLSIMSVLVVSFAWILCKL